MSVPLVWQSECEYGAVFFLAGIIISVSYVNGAERSYLESFEQIKLTNMMLDKEAEKPTNIQSKMRKTDVGYGRYAAGLSSTLPAEISSLRSDMAIGSVPPRSTLITGVVQA